MSQPHKVLAKIDLPLDCGRAAMIAVLRQTVSTGNKFLTIYETEADGEQSMMALTEKQVVALFDFCKGRILGRMTGDHLQYIQSLDQCQEYLRENANLLSRLSQSDEAAAAFVEQAEPDDSINLPALLRCLCLVTRSIFAERTEVPLHPDDASTDDLWDSQEN